MPVKNDTRVITHATPPLVTVRKPKSGYRDLWTHCALEQCDYYTDTADCKCSDEGKPLVTRTINTTTGPHASLDKQQRVERLCSYHLSNPPVPEPTIDEIMSTIKEISKLLYDPRDMSTWNYKWGS